MLALSAGSAPAIRIKRMMLDVRRIMLSGSRARVLPLAVTMAFAAVSGCSSAEEPQDAGQRFPVVSDVRGAAPVQVKGAVWQGGGAVQAYLEPVRQPNGLWAIDGIAPLGAAGGVSHGEPVVALTNTFEVDCEGQRYRKVAETYLSADARPLSRATFASSAWQGELYPVLRWVCGDASAAANGPTFSNMAGLLDAFETLGARGRRDVATPRSLQAN